MNAAAIAAVSSLARKVEVQPLSKLYRIIANETIPPSRRMLDLTGGREVSIFGEADPGLRIFPDGSLTVYAPFVWDGSSPRFMVRLAGIGLFSVGTPNGPVIRGNVRAATRGSMAHDRLCRSAHAIAETLGLPVEAVYAQADLLLKDLVSEDWSPAWGNRFHWAVTKFGDAYRSSSIARKALPA